MSERNKQKTLCKMLHHSLKVYDLHTKIPDTQHSIKHVIPMQKSKKSTKEIFTFRKNSTKRSGTDFLLIDLALFDMCSFILALHVSAI